MRAIGPFSQKDLVNEKGMTLIEVIVAISISTIILAAILFILLTTNRTYNRLMGSYNINSVQIMILEHIRERGVANAVSLKLLDEKTQPPTNNDYINSLKWQGNSLYFNGNIVYSTSVQEDINVYFSSYGNILTIKIMIDNDNYVTSDIYLHNLRNEVAYYGEEKFTAIEWSTISIS